MTQRPPAVSVVVPSLNGAPFLRDALESALSQIPPPVEIVVQDAGSTDGTRELVEAIGDDRIRFVSEPDAGQSDALNRAIARASGEWIAWMNVDDLVYPGLFACADPELDLVYGNFDYVDEHARPVRHVVPHPQLSGERLLTDGCYLFSGAALFRRSLFERFGGLDTNLRYTMDYEFYLRIAPHVRAGYANSTLGAFREHGGSLTSGITWGMFAETARVRRRYNGYGRATRVGVLVDQAKQVVALTIPPVRHRSQSG